MMHKAKIYQNAICRSLRGSVDWNCVKPDKTDGMPQSLPSRERGLKWHIKLNISKCYFMSLPSRERGLKSPTVIYHHSQYLSLPSQERGLKYIYIGWYAWYPAIDPLAEARNHLIKYVLFRKCSQYTLFAMKEWRVRKRKSSVISENRNEYRNGST